MAQPLSVPPGPEVQTSSTLQKASETIEAPEPGRLRKIQAVMEVIKSLIYFAVNFRSGEIGELTAREKKIVAIASETSFPEGTVNPESGEVMPSGSEAGVPEYVENYFGKTPAHMRRLMHMMFHFIELSPLLFGPRRTLFTLLNEEDRRKALNPANAERYMHRVALLAMRAVLSFGYFASPEVQKTIGYTEETDPFGLGEKKPEEAVD